MVSLRLSFGTIVLIASTTMLKAQKVDHDMLKAYTHSAYHDVERSCAMDVELLCAAPQREYSLMSMLYYSSQPTIIFESSSIAVPEVFLLNNFLDQMFLDFSVAPLESSTTSSTTPYFVETIGDESSPNEAHAETGVYDVNEHTFEIPQLQQDVVAHESQHREEHNLLRSGQVGSEQTEISRRRLTGIDSAEKTENSEDQHFVDLPFRCKNDCLRKAFEQQMVSEECARSIVLLENTFVLETKFSSREKDILEFSLIFFYITSSVALFLVWLVIRRSGRSRHAKLTQKVVTTVYNNPAIRKQVELEIGESIGHHSSGDDSEKKKSSSSIKIQKQKNTLSTETISYKGVPVQIV